MEADLSCPKCNAPLVIKGNELVCARETCGYRRDIPRRVPSQDELLEENIKLRDRITELEDLLRRHRKEAP